MIRDYAARDDDNMALILTLFYSCKEISDTSDGWNFGAVYYCLDLNYR